MVPGTVHQLHLSVGAIVQAVHGVARQAETAVREVLEQVRASPVVQGDETGWRQDGSNGYVWRPWGVRALSAKR